MQTVLIIDDNDGVRTALEVLFSIHDVGMEESQRRRLMEAFAEARVAGRGKSVDGFGSGLELSCQYVVSLGGTIDMTSQLGEGSTFTIRLPATFSKTNHDG